MTIAPALPARAVRWRRVWTVGTLTLLGVAFLTGLGLWQLQRRVWKLDLVRKVESRVHGGPHEIPMTAAARPADHDYEHVQITGTYVPGQDTWVHASTVLGAGYWILSPLRTDGAIVLINRGFVSMDVARSAVAVDPATHITGLLRMSEGQGSWPRRNDPLQDRWYSRDVPAIAAARGLQGVAPYFIDAEPAFGSEAPARGGNDVAPVWPVAGLTVVHFRNTHLAYALTWFTLGFMTLIAGVYTVRGEILAHAHDA